MTMMKMKKFNTHNEREKEMNPTEQYNYLRNSIIAILKTYFECDSNGNPNEQYDECYSAEDAIDSITKLIGKF